MGSVKLWQWGGVWSTTECHLKLLELETVLLVLLHFTPMLQGRNLLVLPDNRTTVAYVNRQGGVRFPAFHTLALCEPPLEPLVQVSLRILFLKTALLLVVTSAKGGVAVLIRRSCLRLLRAHTDLGSLRCGPSLLLILGRERGTAPLSVSCPRFGVLCGTYDNG